MTGSEGRILRPGDTCWTRIDSPESGILVDARAYFRAFHRAAQRARRFILLAGWQFDSRVRLLRGRDAEGGALPVELLPYLRRLCELREQLRVYILAWGFNVAYALEREPMQRWLFEWTSPPGIRFEFDNEHPLGASQHQKVVVIDGALAFAGGMDLCQSRWDDRGHAVSHPERRNTSGKVYGPFHDVQACVTGEAARALTSLFRERWRRATAEELHLEPDPAPLVRAVEATVPLGNAQVGLSRTVGPMEKRGIEGVDEIRRLYETAIESAEHLVYIENQYVTSHAFCRALLRRMARPGAGRLEVIFVLPRQLPGAKEQLVMSPAQDRILSGLRNAAGRTGHEMGIYHPCGAGGERGQVYVHSKVLVVDDRLLSVGSANLTNRSLAVDTELAVTWECVGRDDPLGERIRAVRDALLAEHVGAADFLGSEAGVVRRLDELSARPDARLRRHPSSDAEPRVAPGLMRALQRSLIDPEKPLADLDSEDLLAQDEEALFAMGITALERSRT